MATSRGGWFPTTRRWTEDDARAAVDAWKRSGLGAHRFARRHGITAQRLYWWRDRLAGQSPVSLVPGEIIGVADDSKDGHARVVIRLGEAAVEITGASPAWIARLVRELAT
jgi:hypothetical protein